MNIVGERIVLRAIEPDDNEMLLELINDPDTEMMLGGSSLPVSMDSQLKWYNRLENDDSTIRCIISSKNNREALGTIILNEIDQRNGVAHLHIKMALGDVRGKGYGTDAVNTMVRYAFQELRLNCIFANILSYNMPSIKLFEKCGFQRDGILRERVYRHGNFVDVYAYSILVSDQ